MGLESGFVVVVIVARGVGCHISDTCTNLEEPCCCVVLVVVVVEDWRVDLKLGDDGRFTRGCGYARLINTSQPTRRVS